MTRVKFREKIGIREVVKEKKEKIAFRFTEPTLQTWGVLASKDGRQISRRGGLGETHRSSSQVGAFHFPGTFKGIMRLFGTRTEVLLRHHDWEQQEGGCTDSPTA